MIHRMGLFSEYLNLIKEGTKKVEVRLFDEKRRKINTGDIIEFIKVPEQNESIKVKVVELKKYETFKQMYEDIPFKDFGNEGWSLESMVSGTYEIYTREQERQWGALAIRIEH
ncbi:ASCH domain-containing protein [Halobacillus hunanensis]|uniref:ASCH domain-containing protein n=1 Tax=Halobacillus hunanensis TaxID=578214 RepID=UPI0009A7F35C|nr:ASCH domain-containing protein [Halobacillus hunanensis]